MLYLLFGILTFSYFYKMWEHSIFAESKKTTILNLLSVVAIILIWPVFVIIEIIRRIRGEE